MVQTVFSHFHVVVLILGVSNLPVSNGFIVTQSSRSTVRWVRDDVPTSFSASSLAPTTITTNARKNSDRHSKLYQSSRASDTSTSSSRPSFLDINADLTGLGLLLTVPIIWGTYNSVVKMMYAMDPPVPGIFFSAAYFWIGALTLFVMRNALSLDSATVDSSPADAQSGPWWLTWKCGAELGTYLFLGASLQMYGLQSVPADRAGFLIQVRLYQNHADLNSHAFSSLPCWCRFWTSPPSKPKLLGLQVYSPSVACWSWNATVSSLISRPDQIQPVWPWIKA